MKHILHSAAVVAFCSINFGASFKRRKKKQNQKRKKEMAKMAQQHYLQGGYDYDFIEELEHRLECSICLLALRDPYQTSCGHRFCYSCIITWINEGRTCPHDNSSLGEGEDRVWWCASTNSLLWYSIHLPL